MFLFTTFSSTHQSFQQKKLRKLNLLIFHIDDFQRFRVREESDLPPRIKGLALARPFFVALIPRYGTESRTSDFSSFLDESSSSKAIAFSGSNPVFYPNGLNAHLMVGICRFNYSYSQLEW
jgi:hypothetical protein